MARQKIQELVRELVPNCVCEFTHSSVFVNDENGDYFRIDLGKDNLCAYWFLQTAKAVRPNFDRFGFKELKELAKLWGMAGSLYAYKYDPSRSGEYVVSAEERSGHDYLAMYDVPREIKVMVLDYFRKDLLGVAVNVFTDDEGGTYNSVEFKRA